MESSNKNTDLHKFVENEIDLRRYFGLFLSNWYWFALSLFIAGIFAYGINNYSEKIYTVNASLLIKDDRGTSITGLESIMPGGDIFKSQQNLQNEMGILKSFSTNYRVMQELPGFHVTITMIGRRGIAEHRHYNSAPFIVVFDSLSKQKPLVPISLKIKSDKSFEIGINGKELSKEEYSFGERIQESNFDFTILKRDSANFYYDPEMSNHYVFWFNQPEILANTYRSKLVISPVNEEATLVTLFVSGTSAQQEADYLNKLMEVYISQGLEFKNKTAEKTIDFIDKQLGYIEDSLRIAEDTLENFRFENRLIDLSSEGTSIKSKLDRYTQEKVTVELQKQYYVYLSEYLISKNEIDEIVSPSIMGVADQLLVTLVNEYGKLQTEKKQLKYILVENQPAHDLINLKIDDLKKSISENVRNNIINVERTLADIEKRIMSEEHELNKLPRTERRLINIQRQFDLNNTVYTYMLEKRAEAGIAKASNVSGNRIIDFAEPFNASKIKPRTKRNYLFALLLGIIIPGLYIFLIDQLHNKIVDKKDIERGTDVPIIGFIGHNNSKNEIPVKEKPGSSLAESFRTIRTNLKYYLNGEKKAIISVTSTLSGEGKTFMSLNLAAILAMLGKKTLLVGVDLRKPRLNKILGHSDNEGLSTFLIGEADISEIILPTEIENLYFIPSGAIPPNPSELLESEKMSTFMDLIKKEYDYIILDTPPVGVVSDAILLGHYSDINIFVIRQKYSFKSTLELIQDISNKNELKNLTIAVNDIHVSGYYGYGLRYGYGFYQGYGYNYGYGQYGSYGQGDYHKYYTEI